MASKKSVKQLQQMRAIVFHEKTQSYKPVPGYIITDEDEDDWVLQYLNYDHDDEAWRAEFTNGSEVARIKEGRAAFRLYKQV